MRHASTLRFIAESSTTKMVGFHAGTTGITGASGNPGDRCLLESLADTADCIRDRAANASWQDSGVELMCANSWMGSISDDEAIGSRMLMLDCPLVETSRAR